MINRKNKLNKIFFIVTISISAAFLFGCNENNSSHDDHNHLTENKIYTCSMHPQIIRNAPGNCPICGMKLIEKTQGVSLDGNINITDVVKPTDESVISNVKTFTVKELIFRPKITSIGSIEYDTRRFTNIASTIDGRIEHLYVKYQYQVIHKGEKLYDIYSPALQTEVQNLIYLLNHESDNSNLVIASKLKLKLLGLSHMQLDEISTNKQATATLSIYSPADGYVIDNSMNVVSSNQSMPMATLSQNKSASTNSFSMKEGQYVKQGETVFKVINTQKVWAVMNIYADEINHISKGQSVKLIMDNMRDDTLITKIDFVEPVFDSGNKFLKLRAYLDNPTGMLIRGNLFHSYIQTELTSGFWIPKSAVLDLGKEKVVYVQNENMFYARLITTGAAVNQHVRITAGLHSGETIASNAQYLMDSESFIKIKTHEN